LRIFLGILGTALLAATASAIGTDLGSGVLGLFGGDPKPVTYSALEAVNGCGGTLFLRADRARQAASSKPPPSLERQAFQHSHRGIVAGSSLIEVSIQGETSRTITLSRINFIVQRRSRPSGATFALPCGGALRGRFLAVDLDRDPVAVVSSNEDPEVAVGETRGVTLSTSGFAFHGQCQ